MSGFLSKLFGWMRTKPGEGDELSLRPIAAQSVPESARSPIARESFHDSGRTFAVASARWGSHADRHGEHPYAISVASEGGFIACLCDGSGDWGEGVAASRVAAREAAETCAQYVANVPTALSRALVSAHETVRTYSSDEEFGAACSAAIVVIRDAIIHVGWVGTVEVLVIRRGDVAHRTTGHLLWRDLVASGQLSPEDAANWPHKGIVTRSLGVTTPGKEANDAVEVAGPWRADVGDLILLCSRKVYEVLSESELLALANGDDLEQIVRGLLGATLIKEDYFELCAIVIRVDSGANA